jgi:hypothetical protein
MAVDDASAMPVRIAAGNATLSGRFTVRPGRNEVVTEVEVDDDDLIQFRHRGTDQCRGPLRSGPEPVLLLPTPAFPPDQLRFGCQPSRTPPRHTAGNSANQHHRGTLMRDQGPAVDRLASRQHRDQQVDLPRWQPMVKTMPRAGKGVRRHTAE